MPRCSRWTTRCAPTPPPRGPRPGPRARAGLRRPQPARRGVVMTAVAPRPTGSSVRTSKRTEILEARPVNLDGLVEEWPEKGLVATEADFDPPPSARGE